MTKQTSSPVDHRQELQARMADASELLDAADKDVSNAKEELKIAKENRSCRQDSVNAIAKDMRDLERGDYQPGLPLSSE